VDVPSATWQGSVERFIGNIDPVSRTLGVVVAVNQPYKDIQPGIKPPLIKGLYVSVKLSGDSQNLIVLPRETVHGDEVYVVNDNELERIKVQGYALGDVYFVESGLTDGAQVVTNDLFPAAPGMLLASSTDQASQTKIDNWVGEHQ